METSEGGGDFAYRCDQNTALLFDFDGQNPLVVAQSMRPLMQGV